MADILEIYKKSPFSNIGNKIYNIPTEKSVPTIDSNPDIKYILDTKSDFIKNIVIPYSTVLENNSIFGNIIVNPTESIMKLFDKLNVIDRSYVISNNSNLLQNKNNFLKNNTSKISILSASTPIIQASNYYTKYSIDKELPIITSKYASNTQNKNIKLITNIYNENTDHLYTMNQQTSGYKLSNTNSKLIHLYDTQINNPVNLISYSTSMMARSLPNMLDITIIDGTTDMLLQSPLIFHVLAGEMYASSRGLYELINNITYNKGLSTLPLPPTSTTSSDGNFINNNLRELKLPTLNSTLKLPTLVSPLLNQIASKYSNVTNTIANMVGIPDDDKSRMMLHISLGTRYTKSTAFSDNNVKKYHATEYFDAVSYNEINKYNVDSDYLKNFPINGRRYKISNSSDSQITHSIDKTSPYVNKEYEDVSKSKLINKINAIDSKYGIGTKDISKQTIENASGGTQLKAYEDDNLIDFYFEDISTYYETGGSIVIPFRAILTSISDNVNSNWSSIEYVGRPDKFYIYQGVDRKINVSFEVAIYSDAEFQLCWKKINRLHGMCYPVKYLKEVAMQSPMMALTIGNLFERVKVILNSVDISFDGNAMWEIDSQIQLPMHIKISTSFTVLYSDSPIANSRHYAQRQSWIKGDL